MTLKDPFALTPMEALALPQIKSAKPRSGLPPSWYDCFSSEQAVELLFDAVNFDDLYSLSCVLRYGIDLDAHHDMKTGMTPMEIALRHGSLRVADIMSRLVFPLAKTSVRKPYFVIAACCDGMEVITEILRERTRPYVSAEKENRSRGMH